jgi:plastocyanin domain-containing protein
MLALAALLSLAAPALANEPVAIEVSGAYKPDRVEVKAGEPIRLVFTRTTWDNCTREVVFPTLKVRKSLPTNKAVTIDLPALAPGEYPFECGMAMIKGTLVVK